MNGFVVDFEVGASEEVFSAWSASDVGEDVFHGAGYDAWLIFIPALRKKKTVKSKSIESKHKRRLTRVNVFPLAVCPYANTTALYPSIAALT